MDAFALQHVAEERKKLGKLYYEFLRKPTISAGLYVLGAGHEDPQQPHTEDEVYYVVSGRATIRVGEEDRPIESGSVVFVGAEVEHRFHNITENLTTLVFFAPAEYSGDQ